MRYSEQNDELLVSLTLAGDHQAYEGLVLRHQKSVLSAAYAITQNSFMAEDAAQDAFVTAFVKLDMLRDHGKYGAWVCRIAKNCAKNMLSRFREYVSIDQVESADSLTYRLAEAEYSASQENEVLHDSIDRLPEKIKQVIKLHYFEGLTVAEIAEKMLSPVGTVKWQLREGRQKLRKELCAMNEKENDTLVVKVMKKVKELKLWKVRFNKNGFEEIYGDVLKSVEDLPESVDKNHALASTLLCGWWWLPGSKNDEMFAKMKETAFLGHNEEVMEFIVTRELQGVKDKDLIRFIEETQIPFLTENGFRKALGKVLLVLGRTYFQKGDKENCAAAFKNAKSVLTPKDPYYAVIQAEEKIEKILSERYSSVDERTYEVQNGGVNFHIIDNELRYWSDPGYNAGELLSEHTHLNRLMFCGSRCDGYMTVSGVDVGHTINGSNGVTLTFEAKDVTVDTPAGRFEGCELWTTREIDDWRPMRTDTYFKRGVGIVKQECILPAEIEARVLKSYHIVGGDQLLPLCAGNSWEYTMEKQSDLMEHELKYEMIHADGETVNISHYYCVRRVEYDQNNTIDMILKMRNDYVKTLPDGNESLTDVSPLINRAREFATTPYEKTIAESACSVMERILATDEEFNPNRTQAGHWNFFCKYDVDRSDGKIRLYDDRRYSFEYKYITGSTEIPFLYNHVFSILMDILDNTSPDELVLDRETKIEIPHGDKIYTTVYTARRVDSVTTSANTFNDCIEVEINTEGLSAGLEYRGGKKWLVFARGVGLVRMTNKVFDTEHRVTYDLTDYRGVGEGYFPLFSGMMRRYDLIGMGEDDHGYTVYTCEENENGKLVLFANKCGCRDIAK
ncbi:MAG: sigma-70 family RNA polymerase sigma factor [Ruminococcaceae bacterium]|nr:sigma-70 family RNA polymerase sigma factor [Oscillospiraceae bacterium]